MYDDLGLFQRFSFFVCREVLEEFDEFNDLQYLASTKGSSSALVGGRSCHYLHVEPFCLFVFAFYGVLCGNCN